MRSKEIENFEAEETHNQKFRIQYKSANVKELIENPHAYLMFVTQMTRKSVKNYYLVWFCNLSIYHYFHDIGNKFPNHFTKVLPFC